MSSYSQPRRRSCLSKAYNPNENSLASHGKGLGPGLLVLELTHPRGTTRIVKAKVNLVQYWPDLHCAVMDVVFQQSLGLPS